MGDRFYRQRAKVRDDFPNGENAKQQTQPSALRRGMRRGINTPPPNRGKRGDNEHMGENGRKTAVRSLEAQRDQKD